VVGVKRKNFVVVLLSKSANRIPERLTQREVKNRQYEQRVRAGHERPGRDRIRVWRSE
jgi:hypothetical protein